MAKARSKSAVSESRLFVLALGLLMGFVIAFVLWLSRLPVDGIISQRGNIPFAEAGIEDIDFDYYEVLPEQEAARKPERQIVAVEPPVIFMEPPTRVLPEAARPRIERSTAVQTQTVTPVADAQVAEPALPGTAGQAQVNQPVQIREIPASRSGQDSYYVEAGNYRENDDALRAQSILRTIGLEAFIVVRQDNTGGFGHRVRIGPFFEQSRLDVVRSRLRDSGIKPRLIRVKG